MLHSAGTSQRRSKLKASPLTFPEESLLINLIAHLMVDLEVPIYIKVTPDLRGCPGGKNSYARHFKGKHGNLYIVGKLNKCRFQKKILIAGFFNSAKENRKQPRK